MEKKYAFSNSEIAALLRKVWLSYIALGENQFKIIAYDRASQAVEQSSADLSDLWEKEDLTKLPGIGKSIASHLDEFFRTGKVKVYNNIFEKLTPAFFEFIKIPGVGPKTALKLSQELGITQAPNAILRLRKAAILGKISSLTGFGQQSEQRILKSLGKINNNDKRILLAKAINVSDRLLDYLKKLPQVHRADTLGSLRRHQATVGDIDISVASNFPKKVVNYFVSYPKIQEVLEAGTNKARVILKNGFQVDLMVENVESYGALLQHFTGSKAHNIALREYSVKRKMSLSEHGIKYDNKLESFNSEEKFYQRLGIQYIPPDLREGEGEISLALQNKIPELVSQKDLQGDLHIHSNFNIEPSHDLGHSSLAQIYSKAVELGYEYIGLSEHNPSTSKHTEAEIINLINNKKQYIEQFISSDKNREIARVNKLYILNSLEIDILADGSLAIPDKAISILDYAIASIHSSFQLDSGLMTKRVLKALEHPKVKILGHPTGRMLYNRDGYKADWEQIFKYCSQNNKFLEINSWPERLDLPDFLIKKALKFNVKFVINSDSHEVTEMELIKFGVWNARRGWLQKKDIINCFPYSKIKRILLE